MDNTLFLLGVVPLIIFVLGSVLGGYRSGIWSAMVSSLMVLGGIAFLTKEIDEIILIETGLILVFGFASLKMKGSLLFKFQPVMVGLVLVCFLSWFQIFREPYMLVAMKRFAKVSHEANRLMEIPGIDEMLSVVSFQLILITFLHSVSIAWAAMNLSDMGWFLVRLSIYPIFIVVIIVDILAYINPHLIPH